MMQRGWAPVAGLLFLTACRHGTSSDQGGSERRAGAEPIPRIAESLERETAAARTLAAMGAASRDEIAMATIVGQRSQAREVRDYAARIVRQRTEALETITRLGSERRIDLRGAEAEPMIQTELAAGRDAVDRLSRASGEELDMLYLMLEAPGAIRLSRLADQAEGQVRDPESTGSLRRIAAQARDAQARAFALMPRECGGLRDARPAAAPRPAAAFEDPAGRAGSGGAADAGSPRPRGAP